MGVGEGREAMASNLPEGPGEGRLIDFSTWRNKQEIPGKYSAKNCLLPPSSQQRESEKIPNPGRKQGLQYCKILIISFGYIHSILLYVLLTLPAEIIVHLNIHYVVVVKVFLVKQTS